MVKLVGVIGDDDEDKSDKRRECTSRRHFPLEIEPELKMMVALDDSCLGCGPETADKQGQEQKSQKWNRDTDLFLKNYRSLSKDEISASLMVTRNELMTTLSGVVNCVGCRRSVETLYRTLQQSGDDASLEPLMVSPDGVVSVNKEHVNDEYSMTNLFCNQIRKLSLQDLGDMGKGSKKSSRCGFHTKGSKKTVSMFSWIETWYGMVDKCREEVVLLPFSSIRSTLDTYLRRHKFCSECRGMVNKAYKLLIDTGEEPIKAAGEKCPSSTSTMNRDGSINLYYGISVCATNQHIHVACCPNFIRQLFFLVEPELNRESWQEKHAKTLELAQKEILIAIGLALFERFQNIQQKMKEAEQTCDLLFLISLKTLRMSLDLAAEKKRGISDIDLLCEELEKYDKNKEIKKEKKKLKKAQRKDSKIKAIELINSTSTGSCKSKKNEDVLENNTADSDDKENICSPVHCNDICKDQSVKVRDTIEGLRKGIKKSKKKKGSGRKDSRGESMDDSSRESSVPFEVEEDNMKSNVLKNFFQPWNSKTLQEMLDNNVEDYDYSGEDDFIPEEDIQNYLENKENIAIKRHELRENLKQKFAHFCFEGAKCCEISNTR